MQTRSILAVAALMTSGTALSAPPEELLENGGFETGDFTGWEVSASGPGSAEINDGSFDPPGIAPATEAINGAYDALSYQDGPSQQVFSQTVLIPEGVFSAQLAWKDRIYNNAGIFQDPNQEWRVVIRDMDDVVIFEAFSTSTGDTLIQPGPNNRNSDVTAVLQDYVGQELTISFEQQDNLLFFTTYLDDASLLVSVLPVVKEDCRQGLWATFTNVNTGNGIFKNQGDCVSFVATKGRNQPAYPEE